MKRIALIVFALSCIGARLFDDASSDFLRHTAQVDITLPWTVCAWFRTNDLGSDRLVFWTGDNSSGNDDFELRYDSGELISWRIDDGSSTSAFTSAGSVIINTWHHSCATEIAVDDRAILIDGGDKGTDSVSISPAAGHQTSIGVEDDGSPTRYWSGDIAHVAVWSVTLSDAEIVTLSNGFSPMRVHRDELIAYWPLNGQSTEPDVIGTLEMTVTGTTVVEEPPNVRGMIIAP